MVVSSVPACSAVRGWRSFPSHRVTWLSVFLLSWKVSRWSLNHALSYPEKVLVFFLRLLNLPLRASGLVELSAQWRLQESLLCVTGILHASMQNRKWLYMSIIFLSQRHNSVNCLTDSEVSWSPCSDYSEWKAQGVEWVVTVV